MCVVCSILHSRIQYTYCKVVKAIIIHFGYVTLVTFTNKSKLAYILKKKANLKIKFSVNAMQIFVKFKDSSSKS